MGKNVFINTNVWLDYLIHRANQWPFIEQIIAYSVPREIVLFTSSSNIVNLVYLLNQLKFAKTEISEMIMDFLTLTEIINPGKATLLRATKAGFGDLEDAIQYYTALDYGEIDFFITSNIRDFKKSTPLLPVLTPEAFIQNFIK